MRTTILVLAMLCSWGTSYAQGKPDPEERIRDAEVVLGRVDDYTATFHKQERIKGKLSEEETILLKFKRPFKVYMKWIEEPNKGRETLYVEGWNGNKIKAHDGGLLGMIVVNLDPAGSMAMKGNRHPITDIGLDKLLRKTGANLRKAAGNGEVEVREGGEALVYGRRTWKVESLYPKDPSKGYYCHRAITHYDVELKVPIKILIFDWDDKLVESYGYEGLKLNAGLEDTDFSPDNKEYRF